MTRAGKKLAAVLLAVAMIVTFVPVMGTQTVYAEENDPAAIQIVENGTAADITGGQTSKVYLGHYQQSSDGEGEFNIDPIKWRVLENTDGKLFLFSDWILEVEKFNTNANGYTYWYNCSLREWLNGDSDDSFINTAFSASEQHVIMTTDVINPYNPITGGTCGEDTQDKIYLLNIQEATNPDYGFDGDYQAEDSNRLGLKTDYVNSGGRNNAQQMGSAATGDWWLRSMTYSGQLNKAIYVKGAWNGGRIESNGTDLSVSNISVRPVFNLDMDTVLFISAAEGGKACTEGVLTEAGVNAEDEWKLTLLDDGSTPGLDGHKGFEVTSVRTCDGKTLKVGYSGAATGSNEYISFIVKGSEGNIRYYCRAKKSTSSSGTALISIDGRLGENDKLYIFNEQYNGDKKTDFASGLEEIEGPAQVNHDETTVTTKATLSANGSIVKKCKVCGEVLSTVKIPYPKTFTLSCISYTYNGNAKKPDVTVMDVNGRKIDSSNYTVSYSDNVKAGKTAKVTVTFTGSKYKGAKTLTFTIDKAENPVVIKGKTKTVKYAKVKKAKQVIARKDVISLSMKKGAVTYSKTKGNAKITVNKTTGKMTVKKGLKKGTYKVKVKVTDKGNSNYKSKVKTVTVTIKVQ